VVGDRRYRSVRLVIPLRVAEELDEKKYARRNSLASVARSILPWLEQVVGTKGDPGLVREGVTAEVLIEPAPRRRLRDADARFSIPALS
jgi:predicted ribonuclease YlaK